ncbi:MAG: TM0106 family RecB-like putative nuclease [Bacteroidia bacterium]
MRVNNEILNNFIRCQYKAYLKNKQQTGIISDYEILYKQLKQTQKNNFEKTLFDKLIFSNTTFENIIPKEGVALNLKFENENIDLTLDGIEFISKKNIIPIFITPFEKVTKTDKLFLALQASYIQNEFNLQVESCKVVFGKNIRQTKFKLSSFTKTIKKTIGELNKILSDSSEPSLILNNHCPVCEFRNYCKEKAKTDGNMSLLDRATSKVIEKYKKKGIFTIQQLSYLYKPRRRKKQRAKPPISHNIELQALAIRTNKLYVKQLPELSRQPIELFLDIEGNPDKESYYLIGVLICKDLVTTCNSFWADNANDETHIWEQFISITNEYPDSPIYHYGNYESKAIDILGKRHDTNVTGIQKRLINIVNSIYGKIYYPTYSNRLKELGSYIGATWSSLNASGIQSTVWRHQCEEIQNEKYKELLTTYNKEDCHALKLLTDKLSQIQESANALLEVDFVDNPKKNSTGVSTQIHQQFDLILKFAHENYDIHKISFQNSVQQEVLGKKKTGAKTGHLGAFRAIPKASRIITVPIKRTCPTHKCKLIKNSKTAEQTITDIVFTKNSIRKTIFKYIGHKSYCSKCNKFFMPSQIKKIWGKHFGHNFKAWIVYQRLVLKLPFDIIRLNLKEMFNENIGKGGVYTVFYKFAFFYNYTERQNLKQILNSPFVHADETKVNVKGVDHYVWIFTNGKQVIFRETETREINIVMELLRDFKGILISDFYPGYESLKCKHQKCWVHLIRDLNEDLYKNPYDIEYENFILELRNLIIPIFASIEKYQSKKCHFNKFKKSIEAFYNLVILNANYSSEMTLKYQTRIKKHWANLFTFIEFDDIPWNNNMAERGLRHLAIQRKISTFFDKGIKNYLLFLGIMQTCRFQKKSFLKFLLSGKKTI